MDAANGHREMPEPNKPINGTINRILQFGQLVVLGGVLPWGVWVTGQIYGLQTLAAQHEQWRQSREKASVATVTDVELAKARVKDELQQVIATKLDMLLVKVNELDVKLTRHEAATSKP